MDNEMLQTYRLLVVEDHDETRERLSAMLAACDAFEIVAAVATREEGLQALERYRPDILLTDLGLPDGDGSDIIRAIRVAELDTQAMVISGFQDEHRVFNALEAGATGYIHKHDKEQSIIDAILLMMRGGAPISAVIARLMLKRFHPQQPEPAELVEPLTERQEKILRLVSQGFSSREIAEKLDISYYTVTTHIKNIYGKLQVNSRAEAINEAYKLGLME
jgi:DNA-binding NarL/FixJ family response regulator